MKTKTFLWRVMFGCMAALMVGMCSACSSDDAEPSPPTPEQPITGEVDFKIDLPAGSGTGTAYSPVIVRGGDELNLEITQTSNYTDPNGQVITRGPKAIIALEVQLDTVVAKDLASLTKVNDVSDIKTTTSGTSPVRHQTAQKLEVGGQEIAFDLAYEVYTFTNSANEKIEMPYIRLNPAKFGSANSTEETPAGRTVIAVSAVKVRPMAMSRAQTVTDSTMYEVEVRFNIGLESVNTKESDSQALEFSAKYVGIVETTTTLEDLKVELSHAWEVKSGTNSTASPFVQTKGQDMELWLTQTSVYTDEYCNRYTCEPKAKIKISTVGDTVWASSVDELTKLVETSGDVSDATLATQIFSVGTKNISIDWSYEKAEAPDGLDVEMPYYKLSPVKLKNVSHKKLEGNNTATSENNVDAYEITATFAQTATATSSIGNFSQSFDVEYVVTYVGALEVKLVDVKYNRRYEWYDAYDNLALRVCRIFERERIYSNGKTETDEFRSPNYMVSKGCSAGGTTMKYSDEITISHESYDVVRDDYVLTQASKTCVPDLSKLQYEEKDYREYGGPENWPLYSACDGSGTYQDRSDRDRWYTRYVKNDRECILRYIDSGWDIFVSHLSVHLAFNDVFFYFHQDPLTGEERVIDFWDTRMIDEYSVTIEETQIPEGPARIYKHEGKAKYLGKEFRVTVTDTVYQYK